MITVQTVLAGFFKLDGGAMFGVVPKSIWSTKYTCDDRNMCLWAMRSLLITDGDRKILIDTGLGTKQDAKWQSRVEPTGYGILDNLKHVSINPQDITDVIITHLHFDHIGGALTLDARGLSTPTFPNATYWINDQHYAWAMNPNEREKASFLKENFVPLVEQKRVKWLSSERDGYQFSNAIHLDFLFGHTEAMMMPTITLDNGQKLIYCTDLMPSHAHLGIPYVIAYDVRPLITMEEKRKMLDLAAATNSIIVLEHDANVEAIRVGNDSGKMIITNQGNLSGFLGS